MCIRGILDSHDKHDLRGKMLKAIGCSTIVIQEEDRNQREIMCPQMDSWQMSSLTGVWRYLLCVKRQAEQKRQREKRGNGVSRKTQERGKKLLREEVSAKSFHNTSVPNAPPPHTGATTRGDICTPPDIHCRLSHRPPNVEAWGWWRIHRGEYFWSSSCNYLCCSAQTFLTVASY